MKDNPFSAIKNLIILAIGFEMICEECNSKCDAIFCTKSPPRHHVFVSWVLGFFGWSYELFDLNLHGVNLVMDFMFCTNYSQVSKYLAWTNVGEWGNGCSFCWGYGKCGVINFPCSKYRIEDEMPSILGFRIHSKVLHSLALKVNPLHVFFDLNGILVETWLEVFQSTRTKAHTWMLTWLPCFKA